MVRECAVSLSWLLRAAGLTVAGLISGCSLVLDFSDGAIPKDAAPFSAAECDYHEPNDTVAGAAPIAPGDTGPAAICATSDRDFYRFTVPAMTSKVEIRIDYAYRATGDLDLRLLTTGGMDLARSNTFTNQELITCPGDSPACPALLAGDYVFEVFPGSTSSVNRYTIALAITQ